MNVILTGEKHIGKSTVLHKFLALYRGDRAGFLTGFDDRSNIHSRQLIMTDLEGERGLTVVRWENGLPHADINAFDQKGPELLSASAPLIVMDELGKFETDAVRLKNAVTAAFDSSVHIVSVIRLDACEWAQKLKARSDVKLINVTLANRDALPRLLLDLINENK